MLIESLHRLPQTLAQIGGEVEERDIPSRLRTILPQQKVSPVRFEIVSDRVTVLPQPASPSAIDAEATLSAKQGLISAGEKLLDELRRSNCDPRLVDNISELQSQLEKDTDVIRLGIANLGCSAMCGRFESELPDAVGALLRSQTVGISMYVAQFPEWQRFSENAAVADIDEDLTKVIAEAAQQVVSTLRSKPHLADPEVPKILAYLLSFIADPAISAKRSAFAVLRTLENMIIAIYSYGADIFESTFKKSADPIAKGMSRILVTGLFGVALATATSLAPVSVQMQGGVWLRMASDLVQQQLERMSLSLPG